MLDPRNTIMIFLANLAVFFIPVTLLTRLVNIEILLKPSRKSKLIYTAFFILIGFAVMQFPLSSGIGNRIDLRSVSTYMAGTFGGPLAGIITGAAIGFYRFILGGYGADIGLTTSLLQGLTAGLFSKYFIKDRLTQFNPVLICIPVAVSIVLLALVITVIEGAFHLWPYRLWNFVFQFLGALVLTVIIQDALKLSEKTAALQRDLVTDKITNIYNIKFLDTYLNENLSMAAKSDSKLSVVFLDLDFFKTINDSYGHQKGDEILFKVAQIIKQSLRPADVVGRYGGDEFLVILPGCDTPEAKAIGHRIMENIRILQEKEGLVSELSVSMGIATYPTHGATSQLLIKHADNALYTAKNSGRNRLVVAS